MDYEKSFTPPPPNDPRWDAAFAFERSVAAIRKAQGKSNPEDFPFGTKEHTAALDSFLADVVQAMESRGADSFK